MSIFEDQRAFMVACDQTIAPGLNKETELWFRLIQEEYSELREARAEFLQHLSINHKAELAKEAIDLIYVVAGLLNNLNIPADKVWAAVHASNMAKVDPVSGKVRRRDDGKILKPEGYQPPDILSILMNPKGDK